MGRRPLRQELIDHVASTYERVRRENPGKNVSGSMVWAQLKRKEPPGLRKVEQLVAQFKERGTPVNDTAWHVSWDEADESPERVAHLLGIQGAFLALLGRPMYRREARWAGRLSKAFEGAHLYGQVPFIMVYAQRHLISELTDQAFDTRDLDDMLAINILYEDPRVYSSAVQAGLVAKPPTAQEIIETLEIEGSQKAQELTEALGSFLERHPDNPLQAIQAWSQSDPMGAQARRWGLLGKAGVPSDSE